MRPASRGEPAQRAGAERASEIGLGGSNLAPLSQPIEKQQNRHDDGLTPRARGIVAELAAAASGRYLMLRIASLRLGMIVGAGAVEHDTAARALFGAADSNGSVDKRGALAVVREISKGLAKGAENARKRSTENKVENSPEATHSGTADARTAAMDAPDLAAIILMDDELAAEAP